MIKRFFLKLWLEFWFYFLAGIQVIIYFPFLVLILLLPNAYSKLFWVARNMWARVVLHGSGYYVKVENKEKLKTDTNCLIIANHSSHMDVFLMLITCKKPFVFVGKKELYSIPFFGYIYKRAAIMVDRSDSKSKFEVYGRANEMLEKGYNVCIFPETNYLDDTIILADFKRGAFKIAIENNLPIIPLVFYDLKLKHPWYPKFGSLGKLRVKVLDKINVENLTEEDIPSLTIKAYNKIKHELENDPKQAAVKATNNWKKIVS
ncbi:MAG: 1-acyl-sn-glycerol-3-phosphate acyltransferase [Cryomorphaceae bacterium]|jgi:1-acyl-sn-glycerol-3-phosphate acyltransferase|nr:1-acyl-sn-glycerol-3-phosphate acyltransferase [Cryomorphaceae bacterium]MDG1889330.1 lysophospholipid acyltransferase family protein [Flavobacteriaceae bacterium]MBT4221783.1 1-acyl-sn-glycerol-3-phosphate acyltransferase [Cryomorphaceae bacterium]MBT4517103.1 1-acyl-sn-glycerol-3-phosphate acyltransferase [Cryomorphaceae bacterium]MBT4834768.1 1-acyl-sn-glycerol-3-phosphate acyltransferase [Cryomorphaceae bacterium]